MASVRELGHRAGFRVGKAEIRPPACEVAGPGGVETVEPRVMQVLVALAEAGGETVTRDDLVRLCWGGRIVGDDAINRVILKIRKLAEGVAAGSFTIRTVPKIGYRLCEAEEGQIEAAAPASTQEEPPLSRPPAPGPAEKQVLPRRALWIGALAVAAAAGLGWTALESGSTPQPARPGRGTASLDPAARDLALRARAAIYEHTPPQIEQAVGYFRQAVARSPQEPNLWGSLAMVTYFHIAHVPPERQPALIARARQAALRALELDPHEGHAWTALQVLEPNFRKWPAKDRGYRMALEQSDQGSPAPIVHRSRFLAAAGRTDEALREIARANKINPLVPWIVTANINLLAAKGRVDEAERLADEAAALWPRNYDLWAARFFLHAFNGDTEAAMALTDRSKWPYAARASDMALLRRSARAIASGSAADADAVLAEYAQLAGQGQLYAEQAIRIAAYLGRIDYALGSAERLYLGDGDPAAARRLTDHVEYVLPGERLTVGLFAPPVDRLWAEPRFTALMEKIGLVDYWRQTGAPDLCREARMRDTCRRWRLGPAEAAAGAEAAA